MGGGNIRGSYDWAGSGGKEARKERMAVHAREEHIQVAGEEFEVVVRLFILQQAVRVVLLPVWGTVWGNVTTLALSCGAGKLALQ